MRWADQVVHIVRKDVRQERWLVAGYGLFVAALTVQALFFYSTGSGPFQAWVYLAGLIASVLVASLVQSDSPRSANAFWASRPFYPSAMLTAKLVAVLLIVALPALIGQLVVSFVSDASLAQTAMLIVGSARRYGMWLVIALVIAALTRDVRSFAVATLGLVAVAGLVVAVSGFSIPRWIPTIGELLGPLAAIAGVGLVANLYRTHDSRRRTWLVGAAICAGAAIGMVWPTSGDDGPPVLEAAPAMRQATLRIGSWGDEKLTPRDEILLFASIDTGKTGSQLSFAARAMTVLLRDGSSFRVSRSDAHSNLGSVRLPGPREIGLPGRSYDFIPVGFMLSREQSRRLGIGVSRIVVDAELGLQESRVLGRLPLVNGASFSRDGRRVRVEKWSSVAGERSLTVSLFSMPTGNSPISPQQLAFALHNERRDELLPLGWGNRQMNEALTRPTPLFTTSGRGVSFGAIELVPVLSDSASRTMDESWFREAKLVVVERVPVGTYPVRAEMVVK